MKTIEELRARLAEIKAELTEINKEHRGVEFPVEVRDQWNVLNEEHDATEKTIAELVARDERLQRLAGEAGAQERTAEPRTRVHRGPREAEHDVTQIRREATSVEHEQTLLAEHAKRAIEKLVFADKSVDPERSQERMERLVEQDRYVRSDNGYQGGEIAGRILQCSTPQYTKEFFRYVTSKGEHVGDTLRAASYGTTTAGGFGVPVTYDLTLVHTSNSTVNPFRAIGSTETITGSNTWYGLSAGSISASYDAEAAEVSDDTPTWAQPSAVLRAARANVPMSIEIQQDYTGLISDLASLIAEAKDDLEATAFFNGSGTAPNPLGITETANTAGVGTAAFVFTAGTAALAVGDVYAMEESSASAGSGLQPRFRPNAQWVANRKFYNKCRQFSTTDGAATLVDRLRTGIGNNGPTPGNLNLSLLGYPCNELSTMSTAVTTTGTLAAILGDWSKFKIIDRPGMTVKMIDALATANNLPSGQVFMFAMWRNATAITAPTAFKILKVL